MRDWSVIARGEGLVALATKGAVVLVEAPRGGAVAADLRDAIARLAPHVAFGATYHRGDFTERSAMVVEQHMTIGRHARRGSTVAYLVVSCTSVVIDEVVEAHHRDSAAPFDHFAE